jgi:hypothetical protein
MLLEKFSSIKREQPTLQNLKFLHFCGSFLPSWIQLTKMNPVPQHWTVNVHLYLDESNIQAGNVTIISKNAEVRVRRDEP